MGRKFLVFAPDLMYNFSEGDKVKQTLFQNIHCQCHDLSAFFMQLNNLYVMFLDCTAFCTKVRHSINDKTSNSADRFFLTLLFCI